jgi:glycosyltransferase involved in cell wall biosynthesis
VKVSVIIPTFNRAYIIEQAIQSVLAQSFEDFEIIVADDGSTDDTAARIAAIADPRLRYLALPHAGAPAAGRNAGIRQARGEILAFLDSDDLWRPDKLAREVAFLDRHPEASAVFSDLEKYDRGRHTPSFARAAPAFSRWLAEAAPAEERVLPRRLLYLTLLQEVPIMPSAFAIRRAVVGRLGAFDESWTTCEDWEFFLRLARTERFGYLDRPLAVLRVLKDANHRRKYLRGRGAMLALFKRERALCAGDREALAALRLGLGHLRKQLLWVYEEEGRTGAALGCCLRGLVEAHDAAFLLRAAALPVPLAFRRHLGWRRHGAASAAALPVARK